VVGEFNYPSINWDTLKCATTDEVFMDLVQDNVREATRERNILDLVLTSERNIVEDLQVIEHLSTSDHNMVEFNIVAEREFEANIVPRHCFYSNSYQLLHGIVRWKECK